MCDEKDIHPVEPNLGLVIFVLNILCGTIGSLIHAILSPRIGRGLVIWFLQSLTFLFFGIGWIWAIVYGYRIYRVSVNNALKGQGGYQHQAN